MHAAVPLKHDILHLSVCFNLYNDWPSASFAGDNDDAFKYVKFSRARTGPMKQHSCGAFCSIDSFVLTLSYHQGRPPD